MASTDDRSAAECHDLFGTIHALRSEWDEAEVRFSSALRIRERVGHIAQIVESLVGLGLVFERRGDWSDADATLRRAVTMARSIDPCPQLVAALREHGLLLLRGGDSVEGGRVIAEAFELAEAMPDSLEYPPTLLAVAELRLPNDPTSTVQIAERALALGIHAERRVEGHGLAVRGALALDDQQSARYHVHQACNLARKLGHRARSGWRQSPGATWRRPRSAEQSPIVSAADFRLPGAGTRIADPRSASGGFW